MNRQPCWIVVSLALAFGCEGSKPLKNGSSMPGAAGAVWVSGSFKETINLGTGALSTTTVATFLFKID